MHLWICLRWKMFSGMYRVCVCVLKSERERDRTVKVQFKLIFLSKKFVQMNDIRIWGSGPSFQKFKSVIIHKWRHLNKFDPFIITVSFWVIPSVNTDHITQLFFMYIYGCIVITEISMDIILWMCLWFCTKIGIRNISDKIWNGPITVWKGTTTRTDRMNDNNKNKTTASTATAPGLTLIQY